MTFFKFENAKHWAQERANATGWTFSILENVNIHMRDYEYQVIPHEFKDAIEIVKPSKVVR